MYENALNQGSGMMAATEPLAGVLARERSANQPVPESVLSGELGNLAGTVIEMERVVELLVQQLEPACVPGPPKGEGRAHDAAGVPTRGAVVDNVAAASYRLGAVIARINVLRERLTV